MLLRSGRSTRTPIRTIRRRINLPIETPTNSNNMADNESQEDEEDIEQPVIDIKEKFEKYDGKTKEIRIQTWLNLYEAHMVNRSEGDKSHSLLYYLRGSALEWFGDEIAGNLIPWSDIKQRMIKRFGISTATPLVDAQRRRLLRSEKVEDYFRDKIRLLRQAELTEKQICEQLTEGLPFQWRLTVAAARPSDTGSWVEIAQQVETHYNSRSFNPRPNAFNRNKQRRAQTFALTSATDSTTKASRPPQCNYCKRLGKEEFHWHAQCPNRPNKAPNKFRNRPFNRSNTDTNYKSASNNVSIDDTGDNEVALN